MKPNKSDPLRSFHGNLSLEGASERLAINSFFFFFAFPRSALTQEANRTPGEIAELQTAFISVLVSATYQTSQSGT